jgi:hypothetical protein
MALFMLCGYRLVMTYVVCGYCHVRSYVACRYGLVSVVGSGQI